MRIGWQECKIEDYIKLIDYRGRTPVKTESGVRLITAKNVKLGYLQLEPQEFINPNSYDSWMTRGIPNYGDVIFTTEAPLGNVAQINTTEKLAFAQRIIVMQPERNKIDPTFLKYLLLSENIRKRIFEKETGATVTGIKSSLLKKIPILLPPISEQKCIVEIVDETFTAIDKAKTNIEKNLQSVRELFESYLQNVFANAREDWEEKRLIDVFEIKPPKNEAKQKLKESDLVSFLPMEDLNILANDIKVTRERQLKDVIGSYTYFADNDVLLAKITPCFENGKIGIARGLKNGIGFGSSEYIVFRSNGEVLPEFLYYFLSRNRFREEGKVRMTGAVGHKRVSKDFIEEYLIPFPKTKEQKMILKKFDTLSIETKELERLYQQKLDDLEQLKKSILQKAFNGELTAATKNLVA
jgi:type I restriction enzyme S subunit